MRAYFENRVHNSNNPVDAHYAKDFNFLAHWHIDIELVYVCEGQIRIGINKECRTLKTGDFALFSSKDIHYYDSKDLHSSIIIIIFSPEFIRMQGGLPENLQLATPFIDTKMLSGVNSSVQKNIQNIVYSIVKECSDKMKFYDLQIKSKLLELYATIYRYFPTYTIDLSKENRRFPDMELMQVALQYLENNFMNNITLNDIAERVSFSPFYFSRLFKRISGMNFKMYLNSIRIDKAENMLSLTSRTIADIAFECGFNSIRTFNRDFKTIKNCTPSDFRKQLLNKH
jgi:AraC-like DNA-binding protein